MNKVLKKTISMVLAIAMALSVLLDYPLTKKSSAASSTGDPVTVVCDYFPYYYDFSGSGLGASSYGQIPKLTADEQAAYCINSSQDSGSGGNSSTFGVEDTQEQSSLYSLALSYGYTGSTKYGYSAEAEQLATQILIWNISHIDKGWFDESSSEVSGTEASALDIYTAGMGSIASDVKTVYGKIRTKVVGYTTKTPSFSSSTSERKMTYNADTGKWTLTLDDSNSVVSDYNWSAQVSGYSYLSVSTTSSSITFTSTQAFSAKTITASFNESKYDPMSAVVLILIHHQSVDKSQALIKRNIAQTSLYVDHELVLNRNRA